jgi:hypothetical protein
MALQYAQYRMNQGGFPSTVRTNNADEFSGVNLQIYIFDDVKFGAPNRDILDEKKGRVRRLNLNHGVHQLTSRSMPYFIPLQHRMRCW